MNLSALVITKNEATHIGTCLESIQFADEIVVVDSGSTDKTTTIAEKLGARVMVHPFEDFAKQREFTASQAHGRWILFIDADEVVTKELKEEILETIQSADTSHVGFRIPRSNYYFGKIPWPAKEKQSRLFLRTALTGWHGAVHETPVVKGTIGDLQSFLVHYTHDDLTSMTAKTNQWSLIESALLYKTHHPSMQWWRFLRIMLTKFVDSYVRQSGWRAGTAGLIESIYQGFSYFIVYAKLWEKQLHHPDKR